MYNQFVYGREDTEGKDVNKDIMKFSVPGRKHKAIQSGMEV